MLLARKAKISWHGTYMPGKAGLLLPWLPRKSGQGRAFQGWVAEVAIKARLWPGLTSFSRPYFSGKPGQKPGKPGLAGLCQACRAFGRTPDARESIDCQPNNMWCLLNHYIKEGGIIELQRHTTLNYNRSGASP